MTDWDDKYDLLSATRPLYHNPDYWRFLVRDVWRLDDRPRSFVDFGCGYGWAGLFLMPLLASGSDYTGLDWTAPRRCWKRGGRCSPGGPARPASSLAMRRRAPSTMTSSTWRSPTLCSCTWPSPERPWRR